MSYIPDDLLRFLCCIVSGNIVCEREIAFLYIFVCVCVCVDSDDDNVTTTVSCFFKDIVLFYLYLVLYL